MYASLSGFKKPFHEMVGCIWLGLLKFHALIVQTLANLFNCCLFEAKALRVQNFSFICNYIQELENLEKNYRQSKELIYTNFKTKQTEKISLAR